MRAAWVSIVVGLFASVAHAQQPYLVRDINQTEDLSVGYEPAEMVALPAAVVFANADGLWRVDGAGPVLVASLEARDLTRSGDVVFFAGDDGLHQGLFRTDGSPAGTQFVAGSPAGVYEPIDVAGTLYFTSTAAGGDPELWKSDGTPAGTVRVASVYANELRAAGSRLYFIGYEEANGYELWTSDGTAPGTRLVADICPGPCSNLDPDFEAASIGEVLYFVADDGTHGYEIWRSDGTAVGTRLVRDLAPGPETDYPYRLTALGGVVLFGATGDSYALWRTDGTSAGTVRVRSDFGVLLIYATNGIAYVTGGSFTTGSGLWRTDGTTAGTVQIAGCPEPCDLESAADFTTLGGTVLFTRESGYQLWRTNGTAAGTVQVPSTAELAGNFVTVGSWAYFIARAEGHGFEVWRTDGSSAGAVTEASDSSSLPEAVGVVGERFFFEAYRPDTGRELWSSTGTAATTSVVELSPGPASTDSGQGVALGGALLYTPSINGAPASLWRSDGTAAGTRPVAPIRVTSEMAVLEGVAYFGAGADTKTAELWRSDGTTAGTYPVTDLVPGAPGSQPQEVAALADAVVFTVRSDSQGTINKVWRTDGTAAGTWRLTESNCSSLERAGGRVFMICGGGGELWSTDGSISGTRRVGGFSRIEFAEPTDVEGTLFFRGGNFMDSQLWKSDGTELGTGPVQDAAPGPVADRPTSLTASRGRLFFIGTTPETGTELWASDGTSAGTRLVRDIVPGPGSSMVDGELEAVAGGVAFRAATGSTGVELWFSDGTQGGTTPFDEIEAGLPSSDPHSLTSVGSRIFFAARRSPIDTELWTVAFPASASVGDARVHEGDSGTAVASFPVGLSAPAAGAVTIAYSTAAGTAQSGTDFLPTSGVITFPAGSAGSQAVDVAIVGDLQDEPNEAFTLQLTAVSGAATADARGEGVIVDDDGPTIAVAGTTVIEGDAGTTPAAVTATLITKDGAPTPAAKTIGFATEGGTAASGVDFDARSGTVTFPAGVASGATAIVSVPVRGDTADEPLESFTVRFEAQGDETIASPVATVHIQDDDGIDAAAPTEVGPGSVLRADLTPPAGRTSDRDYYVMLQQPQSSYEVVVDEAAGEAAPLAVVRLGGDGSTVLQSAAPTGTGASLSLRWQNTSSSAIPNEPIAVSSASCGSGCGADDRYRLRVYETTLSAPRFNNVNGQGTVVLLQNRSGQPITGRLLFWLPAGWLGHEEPFTVPARGAIAINTLALYPSSGTLTVTHDGPYGALVGKAVALEPATGFSFDTPLTSRPR
jgi:ELWxxDGT repeat protein